MNKRGVLILGVLTGIVAALGVEAYYAASIARDVQREGVTVALPPPLGRVRVKPPEGEGESAVELPASARRTAKGMHKTAALAAVGAAAVVWAIA